MALNHVNGKVNQNKGTMLDYDTCRERLSSSSEVQATHIEVHTGDWSYECNICGAGFRGVGVLNRHYITHKYFSYFHCKSCKNYFSSQSSLNSHYCITPPPKPDEGVNICEDSEDKSNNYTVKVSGYIGVNVPKQKIVSNKKYECELCMKICTSLGNFMKHLRIHTGERPYPCLECGDAFRQSSALKRHILIHTGERPHKCDLCEKCFSDRGNLTKHMVVHTGERRFVCKICGKSYTQSSALNRHSKIHCRSETPVQKRSINERKKSGDGTRFIKCEFCEKSFQEEQDYKWHLRIHIEPIGS